jgi:hypothetical protein
MRKLLVSVLFASTPLVAACAGDGGPTPFDEDIPLSGEDEVKGDAPADAPDDSKADEVFPAQWNEIAGTQSPVKSQGSRGVCSVFATTAQVENLYITAGMANADFSEQYLQWSVKNQVGAFTYTEGSDGGSNLDAVVDYGTVEEAAWRYETAPWGVANDAACTGENRPTRCYTNGEPPASATSARKFKLPSSRWIASSPSSIKHHLVTKKTGVVVGMTFFYQGWNHRASTIPVDTSFWQKGYVTYPNAKDKTESATHRAGHAIMIIGWDDNLEVPMRDETGAYLKNTDGSTKMEKGFWIFKNSWGTSGFGIDHPNGPGYGYLSMKYVREYGNAVTAEIPSLEVQTETACDDDRDNDGDNQTDCDDTDCAANPACSSDPTVHTYTSDPTPDIAIPDDDTTGISDTIAVPDSGSVGSVKVTVAIDHTYRGDLTLSLRHGSTTQTFLREQGGSADDINGSFDVAGFIGASLNGDWTLTVVDGAGQDVGTLQSWSLEIGAN